MTERPLPEAIRGTWFLLPEEGDVEETLQDDGELVALHLDGTFTRYDVSGGGKEEAETGDYTFDGAFLILRGRNTHTYRVHFESDWYWFLEGKKKSRRLMRGLIEERDVFTADDEERRDMIVPTRTRVECLWSDESDAPLELVYKPKGGEPVRIGWFSVEVEPAADNLWIGVTPLVTNLEPQAWEKIVRQAYLDGHLGKPDDVGSVVVELLGADQRQVFDY